MTNFKQIKNHDVQSVYIKVSLDKVFNFIAKPQNLPEWTNAFKEADESSALLVTTNGELKIGLKTEVNRDLGTIDWYMTMPDGNIGAAYSRVVPASDRNTIYSFVLLAPPVPVEEVEGTLLEQMELLRNELKKLKSILENITV